MTISSAGLNEVDLGRLSSIMSSLSTVERSVVNSSAVRASDNASRARAAVLFSARIATSGSLARVPTRDDTSEGRAALLNAALVYFHFIESFLIDEV